MLGNGLRVVMGAVHALKGSIMVELRGHRLTLSVNPADGSTIVKDEPLPRLYRDVGMTVRIDLGSYDPADAHLAQDATNLARKCANYNRASSPWWYGAKDLQMLFAASPAGTTVAEVLSDLKLESGDGREAKTLPAEEVRTLCSSLRETYKQVPPQELGKLGEDAIKHNAGYGYKCGEWNTPAGAIVPYVVEAWASAQAWKEQKFKGFSEATVTLFMNRTRTIARLWGAATSGGIGLRGCDMNRWIELKSANYSVVLSILTPYVQLAGDGKELDLPPFGNAIEDALKRACNAAYRAMDKPDVPVSIKDAAYQVMERAYLKASGDDEYTATCRQIMYAARPLILLLTGRETLDDKYFTKKLLPCFMIENPELTANWKVAFDARGHFTEPHTGREIGLGTVEVAEYLKRKVEIGPAVSLEGSEMYPTWGASNRYRTILFIEKEGFEPLLEEAQIRNRFDVGIMSTKGTSVVACRKLLDKLYAAGLIDSVLVLHDFDVTGFSIFGTLGTDTWRYQFENEVPMVDIGLRLADIEELGLEGEPCSPKNWDASVETLKRHGATEEEIEFLKTKRVELNALTAPQFIEFLERKLSEHTEKVIPADDVMEAHVRRIWEQQQAKERCKEILDQIHTEAATAALPDDLVDQVEELLAEEPELSWDQAVAKVMSAEEG
jgi:hypothetical protein